jgi:putative phosphoribosyl transferase
MPATEAQRGVCVEAAGARLAGEIYLPPHPRGFVLFASSRDLMRLDLRQLDLSRSLNSRGLGTLVFDLVDASDDTNAETDLEVLSGRLLEAVEWSRRQWGVDGLPLGFVGSGLGSAAALVAAAALGPELSGVAIRGGRPDLAGDALAKVRAATLFIFAGDAPTEAESAITAAARLRGPQRILNLPSQLGRDGRWAATDAIGQWLQWHLAAAPAWQTGSERSARADR